MQGIYWKSKKFELHDERGRPLAVAYELERPDADRKWGWFLAGRSVDGTASSLADAMTAAEAALNLTLTQKNTEAFALR